MAPSRTRRNRSRREQSSDQIDADTTQGVRDDEERGVGRSGELDEAPRRRSLAKTSSNTNENGTHESSRRSAGDNDEEAEGQGVNAEVEDGEGALMDLENFKNQPLGAEDGDFESLIKDWTNIIEKFDTTALALVPQVAESMAEVGLGKGREAELVRVAF